MNEFQLANLTPEAIQQREALVLELLREKFPDMNFAPGSVLEQVLAYPWALLGTDSQQQAEALRQSMSLKSVTESPETADPELVDALLSNYMIERKQGESVSGTLVITTDQRASFALRKTAEFKSGDRVFNPIRDYTFVSNLSLATDVGIVVYQPGPQFSGTWLVTIQVQESTVGGASVAVDTPFTLTNVTLPGLRSAVAASAFAAGQTIETNQEMLERLEPGIAAKTTGDRSSIEATLYDAFPTIQDISVIGKGDDEMRRDANNIFGYGGGGMVDTYVRTVGYPTSRSLVVAALPSAVAPDGTIVSDVNVTPTMAPAFYGVDSVKLYGYNENVAYSLMEPAAIYRPSGVAMPALVAPQDARFSMYQGSMTLRINDHNTSTIIYDTFGDSWLADTTTTTAVWINGMLRSYSNQTIASLYTQGYRLYTVYFSTADDVDDIQRYMQARDRTAPGADHLVKAAIPCFVSLSLGIGFRVAAGQPSATALQQLIADTVNAIKFTERTLSAGRIIQAVNQYMGDRGYALLPIQMSGRIYGIDGSIEAITGTSDLIIPNMPDQGITRRITAYYCSPANVTLSFTPVTTSN